MLRRAVQRMPDRTGVGMAVVAVLLMQGCLDSSITGPPPALPIGEVEFAPELGIDLSEMDERESGLWVLDELEGEGSVAGESSLLLVDFEGFLPDGTLFDTSLESEPFTVVVEQGQLIPGFSEGLLGMRAGGQRLILVPPNLGFGAQEVPTSRTVIPANSWLVFRIFLRDVGNGDDPA